MAHQIWIHYLAQVDKSLLSTLDSKRLRNSIATLTVIAFFRVVHNLVRRLSSLACFEELRAESNLVVAGVATRPLLIHLSAHVGSYMAKDADLAAFRF